MESNNTISIGIFFDGTGNNGINATSPQSKKPTKNNESYYSSTTNIYRLYDLFNGNQKAYIEGIGTLTGEEDSSYAMGTCMNPVGYKGYSSDDKLAKAYAFIVDKMKDKTKEYHFYVYGFSRGAMLARTFCYELLKKGTKYTENIKVKFLGIYDTVESTPPTLNYPVNLLPGVENALHLCAVNECRYFFPLTGIFKNSQTMKDEKSVTSTSIWKEMFVPGAHADVGGGYLEGPQSVYISANYTKNAKVVDYVENVRNTKKDSDGNKIWYSLLENYKLDEGMIYSQAYVKRDKVYNDLLKVYGKLMLKETNLVTPIFSTSFNELNFEINSQKHPYLIALSAEIEAYTKDLSPSLKPKYNYQKLVDYTHISANFGLFKTALLKGAQNEIDIELINNGLNVPSDTVALASLNTADLKMKAEAGNLEADSVTDLTYGTNIPNNDIWSRTILVK